MAVNSIPPAPAETSLIQNGRITLPWRAWLNSITSLGQTVANIPGQFLQIANNLSDLASVTAARTNLGLGSAATHNASDFDAAGTASSAASAAQAAAIAASDPVGSAATVQAASLQKSANLSDLVSASTARTNLGLGSAATQASTVFCQTANNLSDVANAGTARTNLGLGGGFSGTVTLAKLTTSGTNGSLTVANGIITSVTAPT